MRAAMSFLWLVSLAPMNLGSPGEPPQGAAPGTGAATKQPAAPNANSYRVKVEPILEPIGKVAIYRVQIWTAQKLDVYIDLEDGAYRGHGLPRAEKDGKHYRTDFVLLVSLRDPP